VPGTPYAIAVYRGRDGLERIEGDWERVIRGLERPRPFHLYEWHWSCLEAMERDDSAVHFFVAYRDGEPVAVFPLKSGVHVRRGIKLRFLEIPHHPQLPLSDFVGAGSEETRGVLSALLSYLAANRRGLAQHLAWDYLSIPRTLEDSCAMALLEVDRPPLRRCEQVGTSDCIPIGSSYEEIERNFSKNFRGDLRKARNKLHATAAVEFVSSSDRATLGTFFDEFLQVESSGWKGIQGTGSAIKLHPELTRFYRNVIEIVAPKRACEINLLRTQGKCIAGQFCIRIGDTYYVLKIGYDEAYARLAPGNMLLEWLLQRLTSEGEVKVLNLVTGVKWHENWKPRSLRVFNAQVFSRSVRGLLFWGYKKFGVRSALPRARPR
jgi:CelD/BcsL family acetyltransferase involved in cellulose biosynthesis